MAKMTKEEVIANGTVVNFERRNLCSTQSNLISIATYAYLGSHYELILGNVYNSTIRRNHKNMEPQAFHNWLQRYIIKIDRIDYFNIVDWEEEFISPTK